MLLVESHCSANEKFLDLYFNEPQQSLKYYFTTEVTSRKTKNLVSFISAPENVNMDNNLGVDENNNIQYPVKVQRAIRTLAEAADLIFIFFDPIGKPPPSKTLNNLKSYEKTTIPKCIFSSQKPVK
ncbi:unnamed protein product [Orchesella dallaii]|uniref:Uncharacterized protein n=1 Tax=Orchesella dallaii TaxID=48710 RepID=A0ABP1QD98_9HEXA